LDPWGDQEKMEILVILVQLAHKEPPVEQVGVFRDQQVSQVERVVLVHKAYRVLMDLMDCLVPRVRPVKVCGHRCIIPLEM